MAEQKTRGDSIRAYLGGGSFDGAHQQDLLLSLGGYRSGFREFSRGFVRNRPIRAIAVEEVSGLCPCGEARLAAIDGTKLRFTPFGVAAGSDVAIAAGETKIIEGADGSWVRVRRLDGALAMAVLSGTETLDVAPVFGNGMGGPDVSGAQATAGLVDQGCVFLRNETGAALDSVMLSASADNGIRIAVEVPVNGAVQSVTNRTTAPTGVTWANPYTTPVAITNWEAGGLRALRIERTTTAGASASPDLAVTLDMAITVGAETFSARLDGRYRVAAAWDERFETWVGQDAEPDVSAAPLAVSTTRPFALPAQALGHEYRFRTGRRNRYGLLMLDELSTPVRIGLDGTSGALPPSAPQEIGLLGLQDGSVLATALYYSGEDPGHAATAAALWLGVGVDPVPATDAPVSFVETLGLAAESLRVTAAGPYQDATDVRGLLRTLRLETAKTVAGITRTSTTATATATGHGFATGDWVKISGADQSDYNGYFKVTVTGANTFTFTVSGTAVTPATGSILAAHCVFSENTTATQATVLTKGPVRVAGTAMLGKMAAIQQTVATPAAQTVYVDQAKNVRFVATTGSVSLYSDTALVWRAIYDSVETSRNGLYLPSDWDLYNDDLSGAGTEGVEVGSWDPSSRVLYVTPRGAVRLLKMDVTAKRLTYVLMDQVDAPAWSTHQGAVWSRWDGVHFQVYDAGLSTWVTYMSVTTDGTWKLLIGYDQRYTQAQIEGL